MVDHSSRGHAKLAPSAASRWSKCLASLIPPKDPVEREESEYAREGTLAHEYFERYMKESPQVLEEIDDDEHPDMAEHVEKFCQKIYTILAKIERTGGLEKVIYEAKVKYNEFLYGTVDCCILYTDVKGNKRMYVLDLKYGRGVGVKAEDNSQLKVYAMAAAASLDWDFERATLAIYQPRNKDACETDLDQWVFTRSDKKKFKKELDQRVKEAVAILREEYEVVPEEIPGDHCIFCPRKLDCAKYRRYISTDALALLDDDTNQPMVPKASSLNDEQISAILAKREDIISFLDEVEKFAIARYMSSKPISGWKLVPGRSSRKLLQNEALEELAKTNQIELYKQKLKNLRDLEKELKKAGVKELPKEVYTYTTPKPKLVPEDDKRQAIETIHSAIELLD